MAGARGAGTAAVKPDVDVARICEGGAFRRCPPSAKITPVLPPPVQFLSPDSPSLPTLKKG